MHNNGYFPLTGYFLSVFLNDLTVCISGVLTCVLIFFKLRAQFGRVFALNYG